MSRTGAVRSVIQWTTDRPRSEMPEPQIMNLAEPWGYCDGEWVENMGAFDKSTQTLSRYLLIDVSRRLVTALTKQPDDDLAAMALGLQFSCGLRIGELLDFDCDHELPWRPMNFRTPG